MNAAHPSKFRAPPPLHLLRINQKHRYIFSITPMQGIIGCFFLILPVVCPRKVCHGYLFEVILHSIQGDVLFRFLYLHIRKGNLFF